MTRTNEIPISGAEGGSLYVQRAETLQRAGQIFDQLVADGDIVLPEATPEPMNNEPPTEE